MRFDRNPTVFFSCDENKVQPLGGLRIDVSAGGERAGVKSWGSAVVTQPNQWSGRGEEKASRALLICLTN